MEFLLSPSTITMGPTSRDEQNQIATITIDECLARNYLG
jgi:hypothetical protein